MGGELDKSDALSSQTERERYPRPLRLTAAATGCHPEGIAFKQCVGNGRHEIYEDLPSGARTTERGEWHDRGQGSSAGATKEADHHKMKL